MKVVRSCELKPGEVAERIFSESFGLGAGR